MPLSKAEMKSHLPAATCKDCVAWFRHAIGSSPDSWHQRYKNCPRCGIAQWETLANLNAKLLGMDAPNPAHKTDERSPHSTLAVDSDDTTDRTWLALYRSNKLKIRLRAATALVDQEKTSTAVLLDILDTLSHHGLGAATERALKSRPSKELLDAMIIRLDSADDFIREVACNVLGRMGDFASTPHLLRMLDDPHAMVRRAAGFALSDIKDPSAIQELRRQLIDRQNDDVNVVWALQNALSSLGVDPDTVR